MLKSKRTYCCVRNIIYQSSNLIIFNIVTNYSINVKLDLLEIYFETQRNSAFASELFQKDGQTNAR